MYGLSAIMNLVGTSQGRLRSSGVKRLKVGSALFICVSVAFGCFSELPTSIDRVKATGPVVNYDPQARPFPIAPFPSDAVTRYDPTSPTAQRLNVSEQEHIDEGRSIRSALNQLEGFGLFAPITLPLKGQLDLATVRHDHIFLVELSDPPRAIPLDLGDGFFPIDSALKWMMGLPPDPMPPSLFFGAENQVDALRWKSDEDRRAALLRYQRGDESYLSHYEVESDTLIIRSIRPLKPHTRYVIALSDQLAGWSERGEYGALRSPFTGRSSTRDDPWVRRAAAWIKSQYGQKIVFGWTWTTGDPRPMLEAVRSGLYGQGTLANLEFTPAFSEVRATDVSDDEPSPQWHPYILPASYLERFSSLAATVTSNSGYAIGFPDVDYFVFGSFLSPQLRSAQREWMVNPSPHGGFEFSAPPRPDEVPFMLSVPKSSVRGEPPFPVMIYFHGTNTSRIEGIILAQELAHQGIALLSFDQIGHGPLLRNYLRFDEENPQYGPILNALPTLIARLLAPERISEVEGRPFSEGIAALSDIGVFRELAVLGRWEDVNQDGVHAEAEGFFDTDPKKLCGAFWQDNVDAMSLVKLLRGLRQHNVPERIGRPDHISDERLQAHMLAGDFNADGVLDIGGPQVQISAGGTSLGGIHAMLFGAFEPEIDVVTPIVPGAGMIDILSRTSLRFIARPLFESYLGQAVIGCPDRGRSATADDQPQHLLISLGDDAERCEEDALESSTLYTLSGDWRGGHVSLHNERTQENAQTEVDTRGGFTLHIASEIGDRMRLRVTPPPHLEAPVFEETFKARVVGHGRRLHTPEFRRAAYLLHQQLERCDPIAFTAPYQADAPRPVKTLISAALGDDTVPINTAISLANALGLLGAQEDEWRPRLEALRDQGVLRGLPPDLVWDPEADPDAPLYDVDQLLLRSTPPNDALGPFPPIPVGDGVSAIRFADVEGNHQWVGGYERDGFSYSRHTLRQVAAYHRCSGRVILDEDPYCLQADSCPTVDHLYLRAECQWRD